MGDTGSLGTDDWIILATFILGIPSTLLATLGAGGYGLGRDIWTLSFDDITLFAKYFYVLQILYVIGLPMVKLSLLFFYLRVFPARPVRRVLWGTIVLILLYTVTFLFISIFECTPVSFFWESWDGEHKGKCLNLHAISWTQYVFQLFRDVDRPKGASYLDSSAIFTNSILIGPQSVSPSMFGCWQFHFPSCQD